LSRDEIIRKRKEKTRLNQSDDDSTPTKQPKVTAEVPIPQVQMFMTVVKYKYEEYTRKQNETVVPNCIAAVIMKNCYLIENVLFAKERLLCKVKVL